MEFLNQKKREIIIAICVVFCIFMLLPVVKISIIRDESIEQESYGEEMYEDEGGEEHRPEHWDERRFTIWSAGQLIDGFKEEYGLTELSPEGIEPDSEDELDKATLALLSVASNLNFSFLFAYLPMFFVIIAAMAVYVKPNAPQGLILLLLTPVSFAMSGITAANAVNAINQNIENIAYYCGLSDDIIGLAHHMQPAFFALCVIPVFMAAGCLLLRKTLPSNNESEKLAKFILGTCAILAVMAVLFITLFLAVKGIPTIHKIGLFSFIFGTKWSPTGDDPQFGIAYLILTSLGGMVGAIAVGVPLGILAAVCISKVLPSGISGFVSAAVDLLAGIPSVIYGVVGVFVIVPAVKLIFDRPSGFTFLSAIVVLSVMVLPTIVSVTTTSLNAVPSTYMEASLALGVTKESSVFRVLIPAARSGIMTGVMLGVGRAIGEAMAIILVAGNTVQFPGLLEPVRFLTTGIVAEMGYATGLHRDVLFSVGLVLFVFILLINSGFKYFIKKAGAKYE